MKVNLLIAAAFAVFLPSRVVSSVNDAARGPEVRQIAIIGAGAAGSSTAYHLRRFADEAGVPVNITIFERTDRVGGRSLTVDAYGDPKERVELGASIFVKINTILYNATKTFELPLTEPGGGQTELLGIWDGEKFVYTQSSKSWNWWNLVKLFWKYGRAPYRCQKLMKTTIAKFLQLYEAPHFPFRSLTARAFELDLSQVTGQTGEQYLADNDISTQFSHDIVQGSTRVNYASNLAHIHGLDTMVSMAPEGAVQVKGGNWQIFDHMVRDAGASLYRNTSVEGIALDAAKDSVSRQARYRLTTSRSSASNKEAYGVVFDNIVIACPYQFAGIRPEDGVIKHAIDEIPYVRLHVTLFASPFLMNPGFFNLEPGDDAYTAVLTTLGPDEDPTKGAGNAGFFSITVQRKITNPTTLKEEYLYKIFSPERVTPGFLTSLLGVEVPETFTVSTKKGAGIDGQHKPLEPISWYHPHVFNSYPRALPRVTFQDPILGDGLYYTSGIESFVSTMETSSLMGMNVARLIVDDFIDSWEREKGATEGQTSAKCEGQNDLGGASESKAQQGTTRFPGEL